MSDLLSFLTLIFWLTFICILLNNFSVIKIFFTAELTWCTLYCITTICGVYVDDLNLISISFLLLALAGLEFSVGMLLVIYTKLTKGSLLNDSNSKAYNQMLLNSSKKISKCN